MHDPLPGLGVARNFDGFLAHTMVKYCSACWRKEQHRNITPPSFLYGVMLVGTLGIAWFLRPKQCLCCGKRRLL